VIKSCADPRTAGRGTLKQTLALSQVRVVVSVAVPTTAVEVVVGVAISRRQGVMTESETNVRGKVNLLGVFNPPSKNF